MIKNIVCSECKCFINNSNNEFLNNSIKCKSCIKEICCCIDIHNNTLRKKTLSLSPNLSIIPKSILFFYFSLLKNYLKIKYHKFKFYLFLISLPIL